jgi:hypothetical protein
MRSIGHIYKKNAIKTKKNVRTKAGNFEKTITSGWSSYSQTVAGVGSRQDLVKCLNWIPSKVTRTYLAACGWWDRLQSDPFSDVPIDVSTVRIFPEYDWLYCFELLCLQFIPTCFFCTPCAQIRSSRSQKLATSVFSSTPVIFECPNSTASRPIFSTSIRLVLARGEYFGCF